MHRVCVARIAYKRNTTHLIPTRHRGAVPRKGTPVTVCISVAKTVAPYPGFPTAEHGMPYYRSVYPLFTPRIRPFPPVFALFLPVSPQFAYPAGSFTRFPEH